MVVIEMHNNISRPHIGGSRWVFLHFNDIYMPISKDVTPTKNFLHTHILSIH